MKRLLSDLSKKLLLALGLLVSAAVPAYAQIPGSPALESRGSEVNYEVTKDFQSLELTVGSSRLVTMPFDVPKVVVEDPSVVVATPVSRNQVLVRGLQTGITGVSFSDAQEKTYTVEINIVNDVRQLQAVLNQTFPTANIAVRPLKGSVVLVGTVPNPDMTAQVVDVAKKFSPEVFQNLQVSGAQNVALEMKVYEVSRTKLRRLGIDWSFSTGKTFGFQSISDILSLDTQAQLVSSNSDTAQFSLLNGNNTFRTMIEALEQHDVAKLLDEPTLVTLNGRPAEFLEGGEVPILVNAGLGVASVEFRPFGTKVDFLPIVLGGGRLRLDLRYEVSQIAEGLSGDTDTPGFTVRRANVAVEMNAGNTLVIAGDIQERVQSTKRGIPGLMHMPWAGAMFRKNQEQVVETELVVIATPRFIGEVDPSMMPELGPGEGTHVPTNSEFYGRGYMEVPRCTPSIEQARYDHYGQQYSVPAGGQSMETAPEAVQIAPISASSQQGQFGSPQQQTPTNGYRPFGSSNQ